MGKLVVAVMRFLLLCIVVLVFPPFVASQPTPLPDLSPTAILYNPADLVSGKTVFFDSGVQNSGSQGTGVFNVRWFVDGVSLGYGSHAGVPANSTVLDGNSQFSWVAVVGTHTIEFAVDVDNHVLESNESNNSRSVTVTVTGPVIEKPAFTLFANPADPLLLKAERKDGNVIEYFGEKNAGGLATAFNAVQV